MIVTRVSFPMLMRQPVEQRGQEARATPGSNELARRRTPRAHHVPQFRRNGVRHRAPDRRTRNGRGDHDEGDACFHFPKPQDREDDPAHRRNSLLQLDNRDDCALDRLEDASQKTERSRSTKATTSAPRMREEGRRNGREGRRVARHIHNGIADLAERREQDRRKCLPDAICHVTTSASTTIVPSTLMPRVHCASRASKWRRETFPAASGKRIEGMSALVKRRCLRWVSAAYASMASAISIGIGDQGIISAGSWRRRRPTPSPSGAGRVAWLRAGSSASDSDRLARFGDRTDVDQMTEVLEMVKERLLRCRCPARSVQRAIRN